MPKMKLIPLDNFWNFVISLPGIELIPQSITTAPGLTQSPLTISGRPIPTTRISAALVCVKKKQKRYGFIIAHLLIDMLPHHII